MSILDMGADYRHTGGGMMIQVKDDLLPEQLSFEDYRFLGTS